MGGTPFIRLAAIQHQFSSRVPVRAKESAKRMLNRLRALLQLQLRETTQVWDMGEHYSGPLTNCFRAHGTTFSEGRDECGHPCGPSVPAQCPPELDAQRMLTV